MILVCVCVCVCVYELGWLFGFYGISTFVGYLMPNPFLCKQFYFEQFSLALVHSLSVKNISISSYLV